MEEEKQQKELFEFERPKRAFPSLASLFPKADFSGRLGITLTAEKIVFIIIAAVMLLVIVYALGVERGKSLYKAPPAPVAIQTKAPVAARTSALTGSATIKIRQVPLAKVAPLPMPGQVSPAPSRSAAGRQSFTIIAGAFTHKDTAQELAGRLTRQGFDAKVLQNNQYFQVCIGSYAGKEEAQNTLRRVRVQCKDAYIKQR